MSVIWLGEHPFLERDVVGGKAYSLNLMMNAGLPVPPAFVLTTEVCGQFHAAGGTLPIGVSAELRHALSRLEERIGRGFGDPARPLLVSVRSGAARSMPGMMDTVLNLGINAEVERGIAELTGDADHAADTARRFREQYERVVGRAPSPEPWEQLLEAVGAVFGSWNSSRAISYRRHHGIADEAGTAVIVQAMVFGNLDDLSGTGVLFSRNPLTGDEAAYGEWLPRGQGEDVVSGRSDPLAVDTLARTQPRVHEELLAAARKLEQLAKDVQDIEFTVESGTLWLLQSRAAKRSPDAAVRLAVSLHESGLITRHEALWRITDDQVAALRRPRITPESRAEAVVLARGETACPGLATGVVVTDVDSACAQAESSVDVVLARPHTDPDDVAGMIAAKAVVTEVGGSTSHAAVVSRELGTPCVVGCGAGTLERLAGQRITVDAGTGEIFDGALPLAPVSEAGSPALATLAEWARDVVGDPEVGMPELFRRAREVGLHKQEEDAPAR
ncbi:pyruvate, phosphate dikinase [Sciscionella marina]|uniref:pyruvate, phosphate dikinase n=1 Tax=Sciscionella marina TaxID=508770 RepID=UPI00036CE94E|nr:pyruvate, phosphate dikinase [Sciscionella marina]